jgi:hypothetical protein
MKEASGFKQSAFAKSTKAAYRTHRNTFLRFCLYFGLTPVPAEQVTLKSYVAFLARSIKPASIGGYLNIIRILHLEAGLDNPLDKNFEVNLIKRGVSRQLGTPAIQKLPLDVEMLRLMFDCYDFTSAVDVAFWSALLLGFFGLLRKSSLLLKSVREKPSSGIRRCDVVNMQFDSFVLLVHRTKTIQFGDRVLRIPFVSCSDDRLCPVRALLRHLTMSKLPAGSSLFNYCCGGRLHLLCQAEFVSKLRFGLGSLGLNPLLYSGHSLRRGGCSLGFSAGLSVIELKSRGDWRSAAVERYVTMSSEQVFSSVRAMTEFASR